MKKILIIFLLLISQSAFAEEHSPQWFSTELKGGFWFPTDKTMKEFFPKGVRMTGEIIQGFLYKSKFGAEVGVGFLSENGTAVTAGGTPSMDRFNLFLLPISTNLAFRADFIENQVLVPYVKLGADYVYFRQNIKGQKVSGVKYGMHGCGGLQILLDGISSDMQTTMEQDWGINDVYFTLEAKYSWINNFGGKGLDLSSMIYYFGLLFEY